MKCPYRKKIGTVDGMVCEYYMECYGTECPHYVADKHYSGGLQTEPYCNKAETDWYLATHPIK